MSIWPHAMSYFRPSSDVDRVRPGDGVLGGRVGRGVRPRHVRRNRPIVDDAAAARLLIFHQPERVLRAQKRAGQVDVDHVLPLIDGEIFERDGRRESPGVVEQEIEPAEPLLRPREQRLDRRRVRRRRSATTASGRRRRRLRRRFAPDDRLVVPARTTA